jgi:hypothetical protein
MMMRRLFLGVWLVAALLLSACALQINTTLRADGSGEMRTEMGFNQEEQQALSGLGTSPEAFCADMQADEGLDADLPVTVETRGSEVWCIITAPFASLDELRSLYSGMGGVTVNALSLSGGELVYDVSVVMAESETEGFGEVQLDYRWQVTLPGQVTDHNADAVDGTTLTWNVGLGRSVNARATANASGGGLGGLGGGQDGPGGLGRGEWLIIALSLLCCCGLLVVIVGGVVFFVMRRRQSAPGSAALPPT